MSTAKDFLAAVNDTVGTSGVVMFVFQLAMMWEVVNSLMSKPDGEPDQSVERDPQRTLEQEEMF